MAAAFRGDPGLRTCTASPWDAVLPVNKQAALRQLPFRRSAGRLTFGSAGLTLGCVTEGGSLAGKLSASSRSSCFCLSLTEFSCFGFLSVLVFAFAVMVRSFEAAGPPKNEPDRQPFPPPLPLIFFDALLAASALMAGCQLFLLRG